MSICALNHSRNKKGSFHWSAAFMKLRLKKVKKWDWSTNFWNDVLACMLPFWDKVFTLHIHFETKFLPLHIHLRQSFCLFTPLLRQRFCLFTPPKNVCTWSGQKQAPPTPPRRTTLSSPWSVGCAADKKLVLFHRAHREEAPPVCSQATFLPFWQDKRRRQGQQSESEHIFLIGGPEKDINENESHN